MKKKISKATYSGVISAPASKSYLQRAIALAFLARGVSHIKGYTFSKDVDAALQIIKEMGAEVSVNHDEIRIVGCGVPDKSFQLNCGESGLSSRMFGPIAALSDQEVIINGEGSLTERPMNMIADALTQLGKNVETNQGKLPLKMSGKMRAFEITIDGSETSQLLTGLLIALSQVDGNSIVNVTNPKSIPYIQMTLDILHDFDVEIEHYNYESYSIRGNQEVSARNYNAEGDWSGAAFHLVAAAISGEVTLLNLNLKSVQADRAIIEALKSCGAQVEEFHHRIKVSKENLNAFQFDATHCPDLFPPLAVLAACCNGRSEISGVSRLKSKESDRAETIRTEFGKLGIDVILDGDKMFIEGCKIKGGKVTSHNDHRIAMALAVLGLVSEDVIEIDGAEAVAKSYPGFFDDFEKLSH